MSYYETCKDCGANLDPGERCDCRTIKRPISDNLILAFDSAQNGDCVVLTIDRKTGNRLEIINQYQDDEAREMYLKLITRAPEGKIRII